MIIPHRDYKLSHYRKTGLDRKIIVLSRSSIKNNLLDVNVNLVSHKILLTACAEKEYVLGFDIEESKLVKFKKDYTLYMTSIRDVLQYCEKNNNSLMIMGEKQNRWVKIDPTDDGMSSFYIELTASS